MASPAPPDLTAAPAGLPGAAAPRPLALGRGLWLVVADAPLASYGSDALERGMPDLAWVSDRAMAHEAMVEHLGRAGAVVPMKLFTLFSNDERAMAELGARRDELAATLARISGCAEWGVRVLWQETRARTERPAAAPGGTDGGLASGRGFLLRKKQLQDGVRDRLRDARAESERLFAELAGHAREARRREPLAGEAGARLLLDAAFLVPAGETAAFDSAVRRSAGHLAANAADLTLSGPWPAYNFVVAAAADDAGGAPEAP